MISIIIFFSSLLLHCFNLLKEKKISFFNSSHHVKRKILIAGWKFNEEDTWQISRTRFKAGECWSLNNDAGSRRLISLKRRLRLVPESARVVNVFPTPFLLCRWSRGSSWKFMTLWNRVAELLGWLERRGKGANEIISRARRHKGGNLCGEAFLKSDREWRLRRRWRKKWCVVNSNGVLFERVFYNLVKVPAIVFRGFRGG